MADTILRPSSRREAKALNLKRYFTGAPCVHGHIAERYTHDGQCQECARAKLKKRDPEKLRQLARRLRETQPEKVKAAKRKYQQENYERFRQLENDSRRAKYENDPAYRVGCIARAMLQRALRMTGNPKRQRTHEALGYTRQELAAHIERQFTPGMSWDKMGAEIEIDHIIPIVEFVKAGVTDMRVINALSNLRPMFSKQNREKRDQVTHLL